jgi:hypothetical protein
MFSEGRVQDAAYEEAKWHYWSGEVEPHREGDHTFW